ncbi:MAG: phage antirepressor [Faecalimonas umbilicata]|uniref:phage antirepressor n=1 Tax=Faecalimonas umbilicata TaxID=1912855 RepID=UPI00300E9BF6
MNELQIFNNEEFGNIRTVTIDNEPWFVGKDVATSLGYERATKAIQDHVDSEDKDEIPIQDSIGRMQKTPIISESGLYALIFGSKLESAKRFKHWVTSEVLPSIRKTGGYDMKQPQGKELLALAVLEAQKTIEEQTAQIEEMKPHAILGQAITTANTSILVGDLAKILRQNGVDIGAQRLFGWMRENGYLIKRKGSDWNLPTQKSMDMGLFEIKESVHIDGNGCNKISRTPKISGKGQKYFINKFLKEGVYNGRSFY